MRSLPISALPVQCPSPAAGRDSGRYLVLWFTQPRPICLRLLLHWARRAASRPLAPPAARAIKMPMIVITTSNSTSVKPQTSLLVSHVVPRAARTLAVVECRLAAVQYLRLVEVSRSENCALVTVAFSAITVLGSGGRWSATALPSGAAKRRMQAHLPTPPGLAELLHWILLDFAGIGREPVLTVARDDGTSPGRSRRKRLYSSHRKKPCRSRWHWVLPKRTTSPGSRAYPAAVCLLG